MENFDVEKLIKYIEPIKDGTNYWLVRTMGGDYYDEYVDKHITSFGGMRVKYKPLIDYLIEPQGARIVKEANEYIVISSSCWTVNINYSAGDLIISLKGSMPLIGQFSKKWTYPSGYPQDKMIGEMENYMTWLMEEYQRLSKG